VTRDAFTVRETAFATRKLPVTTTRFLSLVIYRAFSDVAGKGAFFVVTVMAARRLTQAEFAIFSLGTTIGWIAAVAADAGIQLHVARAIAQQPQRGPRLVTTWAQARIAGAAAALVAVAVLVRWMGMGTGASVALLAFAALYLVHGLTEFFYYVFRGIGRTDIESTLTLTQRVGTLACAALMLWWRPDILFLAFAMAIPAIATLLVSAHRTLTLVGSSAGASKLFSFEADAWPQTFRTFRSDVLPIGIGIVLSAVYFRVDILLLQAWSDGHDVALYNAAFRLVDALRFLPAAGLAVALPSLCRTRSERPLFGLAAALTLSGVGVAVPLIAAADRVVPLLYGALYAEAVPAFRVLMAAYPLMCLNYALTHRLIAWNHQRAYAVLCAAACLFNIVVNARLIPRMSLLGAAWATLWTETLLMLGCVAALGFAGRVAPSAASLQAGVRNGMGTA
jgi:O-antigen/teichoic acid export membrane protein